MVESGPGLSGDGFRLLLEELREIRKRLDHHIDDETSSVDRLQHDMTAIREELSSHRTKMAILSASIAFGVTAFISWVVGAFK